MGMEDAKREIESLRDEIATLTGERDQARQGWGASMLSTKLAMDQLVEAEKRRIQLLSLLIFSTLVSVVQGLIWITWALAWVLGG